MNKCGSFKGTVVRIYFVVITEKITDGAVRILENMSTIRDSPRDFFSD